MPTRSDRAVGCLLGLACGDALGRPVASRSSAEIGRRYGRVTEMRAGGPNGESAGTVTDDTRLALRLARSRVGTDGVGPDDAAGGSLTRCVPHALAHRDPDRLADAVAASPASTPAAPRHVEGCVALAAVLRGLLGGDSPDDALGDALARAADRDAPAEIREALAVATDAEATLATSGSVADTLETALHDGLTAPSAEEAVVTAVNRGGAAALGAVTGALAGARSGADAVPDRWLDPIDEAAELRRLARELDALDPA